MRPALEYTFALTTIINKLQVMQNAALRTDTGSTQEINIHLHDDIHTSHTRAPIALRFTIQTENTISITCLTHYTNIQPTSTHQS